MSTPGLAQQWNLERDSGADKDDVRTVKQRQWVAFQRESNGKPLQRGNTRGQGMG
jgi:hypothetical protein